ncbi:MAG: response regulator [Proteobacteria bacterium]|nr:response regulator [Pseudomonadota bacterium]
MAYEDIPILVVDDAKYSSAIIAKALRSGGFENVRFTDNPLQALRSLQKRPADILISDWQMPSMDGLELTREVKALDAQTRHFTYVMLLTNRDDLQSMRAAFEQGVDDFVSKPNLRLQLLPRVISAYRIARKQNEMLHSTYLLERKVEELTNSDVVDPVTGLGNLKFSLERLAAVLQQANTREQAACLLLVGINNLQSIIDQHEPAVADELISGMSHKIRTLVRPMDLVTRPDTNIFAMITLQDSVTDCTSQSFRRIFDNLYMQSFKTNAGYIPVVVGVSICAADSSTTFPTPEQFMQSAYEGLAKSFETGTIAADRYAVASLVDLDSRSETTRRPGPFVNLHSGSRKDYRQTPPINKKS